MVYPDHYERVLQWLNLVNLKLDTGLSASCIMETNLNFYYRSLLFATIVPLVVLGALKVTHAFSIDAAAKGDLESMALFIALVVYLPVSSISFQTFACGKLDNGIEYLIADYSLTCSTHLHKLFEVYAGCCIVVYPFGIPAALSCWLWYNRHKLEETENVSMRRLLAPYVPWCYFFEIIEFVRRIVLTILAVLLEQGTASHVTLEVIFSFVFFGISEKLAPFRSRWDEWLYRCGACVVFGTMLLTLLLKVDVSDEESKSQEMFAWLLTIVNVVMVVILFGQSLLEVCKEIRLQHVVGPKPGLGEIMLVLNYQQRGQEKRVQLFPKKEA